MFNESFNKNLNNKTSFVTNCPDLYSLLAPRTFYLTKGYVIALTGY